MSGNVKTMFDETQKIHGKLEGKVGAAFTSAGGVATGAETTLLSIIEALLVHGMIIQGRAHDKHYGAAAYLEPDQEETRLCKELGKRTADLVSRLKP
jgi:NAD(P)H dehydrogenase (quinone)